jgi:RND family efflux transporter MFP subunit
VVVYAAALLSGCGGNDARANTVASTAVADASLVPITVFTALKRDVPTVVRATGTFTPDESSDVAAPVSGQVLKTLVNVGDTVKADQPLLLLDDRDARLRLDQARASLERAEADAQHAKTDASRSRELFEKGFTTKSEYERLVNQDTGAAAAVAQARAQLASAQKAVDDATVRAPFAGHVTARPVAAGEYVTPAAKVATIVRIQPIKLELLVKEADAVKVRRGFPVRAEVSGYPGVLFAGSVSALNVAIDPNSRAMTIEATFPNADARVTPGMFGTAQIRLSTTDTAVFAPATAVLKIANADAIYVIEGNRAQLRIVQLGEAQGGMIRIDAGLEAGAVVATNNLDKLADGAAVRLIDVSGAAATAGSR